MSSAVVRQTRFRLLILLCGGVVAAAALAAAFGTPPRTTMTLARGILLGGDGFQLTSDAAGASTVIWTAQRPVNGVGGSSVLYARQQNTTHSWGATVQIGGVTQINNQQLVESRSGAAVVVWTYYAAGRGVIGAVTRPSADAGWSAPLTIVSGAAAAVDSAQVAVGIDAAGMATVAWSAGQAANPAISVAGVNAATGRVSPPVHVVDVGSGGDAPVLAVSRDGAAVLSWQRQVASVRGHSFTVVRDVEMAVYRPARGDWGAPARLGAYSQRLEGEGAEVWVPESATSTVTADGTAAVAWRGGGPAVDAPLDVATRGIDTGTWSTGHVLTHDVGGFGLVSGPRNDLVAEWSADNESFSATRAAAVAAWPAGTEVARTATGTDGSDMTADPNGRVALTPEAGNAVRYTVRSTAGTWSDLLKAGTGENSEITFGHAGDLTLVWENVYRHGQGYEDALSTRTVR